MAKTDRLQIGGAVQADLDALVKDLRAVDRDLPKQLQKAHKQIATLAVGNARSRIGRLQGAARGWVRSSAAEGVRPRARQKSASVALLGRSGARKVSPQAFEFGTRFHPVPAGRGRRFVRFIPAESMSRRVFPPWVGNRFDGGDWKDGVHGKQGHFVAPAIAELIDNRTFAETYASFIERSMRKLAD